MDDSTCFYCLKDQRLDNLMIEIAQLSVSTLYLNKDQTHLGRCIVAYNQHANEIFELDQQEQHLFINDVSLVAKVLKQIFHPDKLNYGIYGDLVSHLHVHLVPKLKRSQEWGEAFINCPLSKHFLDNDRYNEIVKQIKKNINREG